MTFLGWLLLSLAAAGTASSAVFLGIALAGVRKFRNDARQQKRLASQMTLAELPAVSILKPLHGVEPQLEANLESFFQQEYPRFEILFGADTAADLALPIARKLCEKYPDVPCKILITGEPPWPNPPAYCFYKMSEVARFDVLVTSDSDVIVDRDYLSSIVPPLMDRRNGMLTCVYRGMNTGGFWSLLDAVGMSVEMTAGVLAANVLEGMKFGLGPTIAVRRDALNKIGGYEVLGDYFANDFMIGNLIAKEGYEVLLSGHIISHVVPFMTFKQMWQRQLRWATGTKHSRPKGHFGTVFTYSIPYGILGFVGALLLHKAEWGLALLAWAVLNRIIESIAIGWFVTRDRACLLRPWVYPVRDLLGFCVWVASYLSRNMTWRDGRFELTSGGKILVREREGTSVHMSARS